MKVAARLLILIIAKQAVAALNAAMATPVLLLSAPDLTINSISQEPALLVRVIVYVQFGILMAVVKSHIIIAAKK